MTNSISDLDFRLAQAERNRKPVPPPGSAEAVGRGCLCPVTDNHSGSGYMVRNGLVQYWQNGACPLHGALSGYRVIDDSSPAEEWDAP